MPSAPIRQLLIVEALGHSRVPFAGYRPDHRAGVDEQRELIVAGRKHQANGHQQHV